MPMTNDQRAVAVNEQALSMYDQELDRLRMRGWVLAKQVARAPCHGESMQELRQVVARYDLLDKQLYDTLGLFFDIVDDKEA